nr:MAG TPA: hypothetical protein [Ackermannviridae sp.]
MNCSEIKHYVLKVNSSKIEQTVLNANENFWEKSLALSLLV